jgi:hypothetical protein
MEQQFQLKYHGNLDLYEQEAIVAEDRKWWLERIAKEKKEEAERQKQNQPAQRRIPRLKRR